jgi:hypothetical protein
MACLGMKDPDMGYADPRVRHLVHHACTDPADHYAALPSRGRDGDGSSSLKAGPILA